MQEVKLDMMAPKEEQLKVLVPYLEYLLGIDKGKEKEAEELPLTTQSKVLVSRYLWNWLEGEHYNKKGLTPQGAILYYKVIK